jgi:hypothetical protein
VKKVRGLALALVVMLPSAPLAKGLGPADDAPVVEQKPSARLLPADTPDPVPDPAPDPTPVFYKRGGFWWLMAGTTLSTAGLVAVAVFLDLLFFGPRSKPRPLPPQSLRFPSSRPGADPAAPA